MGARRRSADAVLEWLIGGYMALTLIGTWAMVPDDIGPGFTAFAWIVLATVLFLPFCVFAAVVIAIVEFLED